MDFLVSVRKTSLDTCTAPLKASFAETGWVIGLEDDTGNKLDAIVVDVQIHSWWATALSL